MKLKKKLHNELNRYPTPDRDRVLGAYAAPDSASTARHTPRRKKWLTAPLAIAMACMLMFGAAAAGVTVIRYLNSELITENNLRLTEVPEGYVAIYTVEDLVQMRQDVIDGTCADNYILMNDITFTDVDYAAGGICEGGWEPIDFITYGYFLGDLMTDGIPEGYGSAGQHGGTDYIQASKSSGFEIFNGNGYVIRNLLIRADATEALRTNEYGYEEDLYLGLFGNPSWHPLRIINLGIEGCDIYVDGIDLDIYSGSILIGGIAAQAHYVGASYVKDMNVHLNLATKPYTGPAGMVVTDTETQILIGGIVGNANYVDACYNENYTMNLSAEGHPCVILNAGGIGGKVKACLTSWSNGTWQVSGDAYLTSDCGDLLPASNNITVPTIIPAETFDLLDEKLKQAYGADTFEYKKLRAHFVAKNFELCTNDRMRAEMKTALDTWNHMYGLATGNPDTYYDSIYIFDPTATLEEIAEVSQALAAVFDSEEDYRTFCTENSLIAGEIYCHTLDGASDKKETDFEGFNFTTLWTLKDGIPRLRIFSE